MLSQKFRDLLEYKLTKALTESGDKELRRYWCDGVLGPELVEDYLPRYVAKSKVIILQAWMVGARTKTEPSTHQLHPLHLKLGPASLSTYIKEQDLSKWVVDGIESVWVSIGANENVFEADRTVFQIQLP